ncbi:DUF4115 domain-containing protein [Acetobacter farinalis]|uniref:DUF4115 domain-containing protein n=1 Tax=Acetobacter farinalis TaxID=1260984 RepID=A0ABT3Q4U7_9PROT|nr:RodZ domain-containing protein [Acetobacter farinalis]MCX2560313.1 DUF4115 domain-containing protein [Acetobacter farinalis]NHO28968.1 DUF4115 domain-containing protein [Acetobacter farinalis]
MAEPGFVPEQDAPVSAPALPDVESLGVGAALCKRREQLGWSLADVAAWLRIRESYLEALESGRAGVFPAEAYALGFLRTYGSALGFDASVLVQRYKREGKGAARKPELTFPAPVPDRRIPPGVTVSLGLAVILASYVGWYHFIGHAPPVPEHVPPVEAIIPGAQTNNTPSPQVASILPGPDAVPAHRPEDQSAAPLQPQAGTQPAVMAEGQTSAPSTPSSTAAGPAVQGGEGPGAAAQGGSSPADSSQAASFLPSVDQAPHPQSADSAQPVTAPDNQSDNQIVLKAIGSSWVQVKDASGKVAYDHVMQPNDQWSVPAEGGPYILTVGNAGGIVLSAGGVTTQPLGRNGAVRRKLELTPEAVKAGSLAALAPSGASVGAPVSPSAPAAPASVPAIPPANPASGSSDGSAASAPQNDVPAGVNAAGAMPGVSGEGQSGQASPAVDTPPPVLPKPRPRRRPAPKPEPSADDLNARQLQSIAGH